MLTKTQYFLSATLGGAAIALAVANGVMFTANQAVQAELAQKQAYLQQTGQLEGIYTNIATSLAQWAVKDNDRAVIDMLGNLGLRVTTNAAPAAETAPAKKQ
ncbi:hypothetical protein [Rhodoferax bucti]|uniref:hypothetical protein n=1 Tax=Rhodoferax bucti TaxID=2576305 RepID=UPI0011084E86|nr:hypothetical protein [Rhodoferax bucti]